MTPLLADSSDTTSKFCFHWMTVASVCVLYCTQWEHGRIIITVSKSSVEKEDTFECQRWSYLFSLCNLCSHYPNVLLHYQNSWCIVTSVGYGLSIHWSLQRCQCVEQSRLECHSPINTHISQRKRNRNSLLGAFVVACIDFGSFNPGEFEFWGTTLEFIQSMLWMQAQGKLNNLNKQTSSCVCTFQVSDLQP